MLAKNIFPLSNKTKWIFFLTILSIAHIAALVGIAKSGLNLHQVPDETGTIFHVSLIIIATAFLFFDLGGRLCMLISGALFIIGIVLAIALSIQYSIFIFLYLLVTDLVLVFKLMERIC